MRIRFWGVRGSIPTPSTPDFSTSRYGGNTTCVCIRAPGLCLILDGGSGLRALGLRLTREMPFKASFFFSHFHWDHIQGFPFFIPAFTPGNTFTLYGPAFTGANGVNAGVLEKTIRNQQQSFNFPVQVSEMAAALKFEDISDGQKIEFQGTSSRIVVTAGALNHPGGCFGFRVEEHHAERSSAFVYATDTEHFDTLNPSLQKLAAGADTMLYDAQYTLDEYFGRGGIHHMGWGHSTYQHGIREARAAGVRRLLLTHHDPLHDDWAVARIENDARREGIKAGIDVVAAYEGMAIGL